MEAAEDAVRDHVGRLRLRAQARPLRAPDAARDPLAAEHLAEVEAALVRHVDDHLRPAGLLAQLDRGVVDQALRLLVVRDQLDLDAAVGSPRRP